MNGASLKWMVGVLVSVLPVAAMAAEPSSESEPVLDLHSLFEAAPADQQPSVETAEFLKRVLERQAAQEESAAEPADPDVMIAQLQQELATLRVGADAMLDDLLARDAWVNRVAALSDPDVRQQLLDALARREQAAAAESP